MATGRAVSAVLLTLVCVISARGQSTVSPSAPGSDPTLVHRPVGAPKPSAIEIIPLMVPKGTSIQVVLDKEVRIHKVGQPVHGRTAEAVYAFDKLVVPVGTEVTGQITELDGVSGRKRTFDALNADFTPPRKVQMEFNELVLLEGRHIPIHTAVTPGSGRVIRFVTAAGGGTKKGVKDVASEKVNRAKQEAKQEWDNAMKQVHEPGKIDKIKRYAVAQLPIHPQYLDAGTVYFAELEEPLDFGTEPLTPEVASSMITRPPRGFVHVRLMTGLSSATTRKGDEVDAVLSQPLFDGQSLLLPQGSHLKGSVVQVRPARRFSRNGKLRITFHELVLSDGIEQKVDATLESVQSDKGQGVKLDSEGGAEANSPKTRYLTTGISVALAFASSRTDSDAPNGDVGGNTSNRMAGGAGGFKLVGLALGAFVHSQPLGMAMGVYGASMSIYSHFIARGRDLVFPKNTAMEIAIGTRASAPASRSPRSSDANVTRQ